MACAAFLILQWIARWRTAADVQINPDVCAKIQPGMTLDEVEKIIGGPPGSYVVRGSKTAEPSQVKAWIWANDGWQICVKMDNGKVNSASCSTVENAD
jgi:hypothetical protein